MDCVYKMKFCDTPEKRMLALRSIESFVEDKPKSGVCGYRYNNFHGSIFVREMESGNIIAHWQDE